METYARELYRAIGAMESDYEFVGYASEEGYPLDRSWFPGEVVDSGISGENRFIWAYGELFAVARHAKRLGVDLVHSPAPSARCAPGCRASSPCTTCSTGATPN